MTEQESREVKIAINELEQLIVDFVKFMCAPIEFLIDLMKGAEE